MRVSPVFCAVLIHVSLLGAAEPSPEVTKYHEMLLKRPAFGVVFDRFTDAWFASGSTDELRDFLVAKAGAAGATAEDQVVLALFHVRQAEETEALAAFSKALDMNPANASAWQERARLEMRMLDFTGALKSLDTALAQKPEEKTEVELTKLRGRVLLRTGKPEDALQAWRELLKSHPADEDLAEEVVDLQMDEGLNAEAAATMRTLIGKTKDAYTKVGRQLRLAEILMRTNDKAGALAELGACLEQSGRDTWIEGEALAQIERIFRREDNFVGLMEHLAKLATADDTRVTVQRLLARVQADSGEKDKALANYVKLLERTPGRRDLREGYLDLLERFEKYADAIAQTKLLIEQNPGDKELHLRLAAVHERAKDLKSAQAALEAYLAAKGTTEFDHLRVARMLEQWSRIPEAKAAYVRMVTAFPESAGAKEAQAHFLHRNGEKEGALAIWRELAAKGGLEELLAVSQALLARMEPKTAFEVMKARLKEFEKEPRFLAPLITAAVALKEEKAAVPWAMDRLKLTQDAAMLDEALLQAVEVLKGALEVGNTLNALKAGSLSDFSQRALLATLLEESAEHAEAEKVLRDAPPAQATLAQARLVRLIESRKDWLRAAEELEKLIAMPEGRTSQHVQRLVDLKQRAGETEAALKLIPDWKTLSPGAVQPWLMEAGLLAQLNRQKDGIQVLRAAARKFEDDDQVAVNLAQAYADAGQFADGERIFLGLVEDAEELEEKLRWVSGLAQMAQTRAKLSQVVEKFKERQRTNRADAAPWLALAAIHQVSSNHAEQRRCLAEASRLRPTDVSLLHDIARVDEIMGNWKDALRVLEQAAPMDTTMRTKHLLAILQMQWGDENAGYNALIELMGGEQMDAKDVMKLTEAMMTRDQWKRAAEFLQPFVQRMPEDYRLRYLRAIALMEDTQTEAATEEFVQVLAIKEELPEVLQRKAKAPPSAQQSWTEQFKKLYPPGMVRMMEIIQNGYSAQQHIYRRQYNQTGSGSGVLVPPGLEEAKSYAVINAIHLIQEDKGGAAKSRLTQALKGAGWAEAEALMCLEPPAQGTYGLSIREEALKAHPDDMLLHAAWLVTAGYYDGSNGEFETCRRCAELFKEKYPELTMMAAIMAARLDLSAGSPLLEAAIQKLETNGGALNEEGYIGSLLVQVLGGGPQRGNELKIDLPEPIRKRICKVLVLSAKAREGKALTAKPASWNYPPIVVASQGLRAEGAWEDYIGMWDDAFAKFHKADAATRKALTTWTTPSMSYQQPKPLLEALEFPPICQSMPAAFAVLMRYDDPVNMHIPQWHHPGPEDDYAPVAKLLDTVKDPVLRLVLAYKADQKARVESELAALMASPQAGAEALLLSASYYSSKGDAMRAAELLHRCVSGPMEATLRAAADAAFVHAVINMTDAQIKGLPAEVAKASHQAVRRLRSGQLTQEHRDELTNALVKLGLKEEAEQWKRLATVAPTTSTASQRTYYSSSQAKDKVDQLIKQNATEDAILRAVVQELKSIHGNYWDGNQDYARQQTKQLVEKLRFADGKKKLIAVLDPGEGANESRRLEFATRLDMLSENERAISLYQSVLASNPKQADARSRMIVLISRKSAEQAADLIMKTTWEELAHGAGQALVNELYDGESADFKTRMSLFESLAGYLDKLAATPPPRGALEWARHLPEAAAHYNYNTSLPPLYYRNPESRTSGRASPADLARRLAVHEAVCRAVMKFPEIASEGFGGLAGLAMFENKSVEEFAPLAERLLKEAAEAQAARTNAYRGPASQWQWGSERAYEFWRPTPGEFLVWQAWKSGTPGRIEAEVLPLAEKAKADPKGLRAAAAMWTCAPEAFTTTATAYLRANRTGYLAIPLMNSIDCWAARKLPLAGMDDFFGSHLKRTNGGSETSHILAYYFILRSDMNEAHATLEESYRHLTAALIGPESGWSKKITDALDYQYGRGGNRRWDANSYAVTNGVGDIISNPKTTPFGIKLAEMLGLMQHDNWRSNRFDSAMVAVAKKPDTTLAMLASAPFLKEAAEFDTWGASGRTTSPLMRLMTELKSKPDVRDPVREALKQRQPATFGVEMVQAMLEENQAAALTAALKRRAADIPLIPESRRPELAKLFISMIPALKTPATADPALRKVLEPLMASQFKEQETRVEAWLKAKQASEMKLSDSAYEAELIRVVAELVLKDRAKAKALFLHACTLMEDKENRQGWSSSNAGNGWLLRSYILSEVMEATPKMEMLGFSLQLFQEDTTGNLTMNGWSTSSKWGTALHEVWKANGGLGNNARGMQAMVARVQQELGDTPPALLGIAFYDFYAKLPQSLRVPALKWAEKPSQDPALAPVMKELAMAGRFFLSTETASRGNAGVQKTLEELGGLAPAWEHASTHFKNEAINPRVRQALGHHLCYIAPLAVTPEIIVASEQLALQSIREGHCIHGYQHGWIMKAFCRLPADEAWKEKALVHWEAWIARTSQSPRSSTRRYDPHDWPLHNMIRLAAHAGQEEWTSRLLRVYQRTLTNEPSALAVLVGEGRHKEAVDWLKSNWHISAAAYEKGLLWSTELAANLPAFREACGAPDMALLGEIMLAQIPDPPKPDQADIPNFQDRTKRLVALAEKLPGTKFTDDVMRTRCLQYLAQVYETYDKLAREYDEAAAKTDIPMVVALDDTWAQWRQLKPLRASISRKAWEGDAKAAITAFDQALGGTNSSSYYKRYALSQIGLDPLQAVPYKLARQENADWRPLLTLVDHMLTKVPKVKDEEFEFTDDAIALKLLIHHARGEADAVTKWRASLNKEDAEWLASQFSDPLELWNQLRLYGGQPKPRVPVEQRAALVASLLKDEWMAKLYPLTGSTANLMGTLVTKARVFTVEELATAWRPIAESHPRKGRSAAEAADLLAQNNRLPEALEAFELAATQTEKEYGTSAGFRYRKAEVLERMNRKDEARELVTALEEKRLNATLKNQRANMLKRLGPPASL